MDVFKLLLLFMFKLWYELYEINFDLDKCGLKYSFLFNLVFLMWIFCVGKMGEIGLFFGDVVKVYLVRERDIVKFSEVRMIFIMVFLFYVIGFIVVLCC